MERSGSVTAQRCVPGRTVPPPPLPSVWALLSDSTCDLNGPKPPLWELTGRAIPRTAVPKGDLGREGAGSATCEASISTLRFWDCERQSGTFFHGQEQGLLQEGGLLLGWQE